MKCLKCGAELSTVKNDFDLMIKDYSINKQTHVCNSDDILSFKQNESSKLKEIVKDVNRKQKELMTSKDINQNILAVPMDAPSKLEYQCRCIYWDGKCHHCGNKNK